jgi:P-aminobenzoate N-oxygenase AurF
MPTLVKNKGISDEDVMVIERLIAISETKPLDPETFVPWKEEAVETDIFLPEKIVSLYGHPLYETLTRQQKIDLGRKEVAQVMYSYAWTEGLACLLFNRRILKLTPDKLEYRFLTRELIEEFRHQAMFAKGIQKLGGGIHEPAWWQKGLAKVALTFFPDSWLFLCVVAIELVADTYGKLIRKDEGVYKVVRKISELHHIEEGRHIHYTALWLKQFTEKAGIIKRSIYSIIIMINIFFLRSLYVKEKIFEEIGVEDPSRYTRAARKQIKINFSQHCLGEAIEFTHTLRGYNAFTKKLWNAVLNTHL